MAKKRKIVYLYENLQNPENSTDASTVSSDQFIKAVSLKSGVPVEDVEEIVGIYAKVIKEKVEEYGEYVLEGKGDVDYVFKKPVFH